VAFGHLAPSALSSASLFSVALFSVALFSVSLSYKSDPLPYKNDPRPYRSDPLPCTVPGIHSKVAKVDGGKNRDGAGRRRRTENSFLRV
jgi:hypothetical protein